MKPFFLKAFLPFVIALLLCYQPLAQPASGGSLQRVIIIRHGEKPASGDNLSCQGLNRAMQLSNVLYAKFKLPDYVFVPSIKNGKSTSSARMYQTIVPFAAKYNLNIDSKYRVDDVQHLAASISKKSGSILVVWEHNAIPAIVQALGVKNATLKWKGDDFDSIWIITFKNGKPVLSFDEEGLHPSPACN